MSKYQEFYKFLIFDIEKSIIFATESTLTWQTSSMILRNQFLSDKHHQWFAKINSYLINIINILPTSTPTRQTLSMVYRHQLLHDKHHQWFYGINSYLTNIINGLPESTLIPCYFLHSFFLLLVLSRGDIRRSRRAR